MLHLDSFQDSSTWDLDSAIKSVVSLETSSLSDSQAFASIPRSPDKLEPRNPQVAKDNPSCVRLEQVQQDKMLLIAGFPTPHKRTVHNQSVAWNLFDPTDSHQPSNYTSWEDLGSLFRPKVCTRPLRTFWNVCVCVSHVTFRKFIHMILTFIFLGKTSQASLDHRKVGVRRGQSGRTSNQVEQDPQHRPAFPGGNLCGPWNYWMANDCSDSAQNQPHFKQATLRICRWQRAKFHLLKWRRCRGAAQAGAKR